MRSADVTAAGTWGGSTQASDDDEDAYPSNGIVHVEEEEEQVCQWLGDFHMKSAYCYKL